MDVNEFSELLKVIDTDYLEIRDLYLRSNNESYKRFYIENIIDSIDVDLQT